MTFRTIVVDPPWPQDMGGVRRRKKERTVKRRLPYEPMSVDAIKELPIQSVVGFRCLLFLWTTNQFLEAWFSVLRGWGFKYLAPVHWVKPTGTGNWFIHRTQTILVAYSGGCQMRQRYLPNVVTTGDPVRHSQKPEAATVLIEAAGYGNRLEIFSRQQRDGWTCIGNEVTGRDVRVDLKLLAASNQGE